MAQNLRPDGDISNGGGWKDQGGGTTNLYSTIDEASTDDADYDTSPNCPTTAELTVSLTDATDPQSSSGHIIHFRSRQNSGSVPQVQLTVVLKQGSTTIASTSFTHTANNTFADHTYTLSGAEADSITDYNDLRLQFSATRSGACLGNPHVDVSQAWFEVPDAPARRRSVICGLLPFVPLLAHSAQKWLALVSSKWVPRYTKLSSWLAGRQTNPSMARHPHNFGGTYDTFFG
jgi:hypothetical protein